VCGISEGQSIFAGGGFQKCAKMSDHQIAQFPNISVVLEGADPLTIDGTTYLVEQSGGCYTMGLIAGGATGTILGDVFLQAFNVIFDRANMRVGFGPLSTCSTDPMTTTSSGTSAGGSSGTNSGTNSGTGNGGSSSIGTNSQTTGQSSTSDSQSSSTSAGNQSSTGSTSSSSSGKTKHHGKTSKPHH